MTKAWGWWAVGLFACSIGCASPDDDSAEIEAIAKTDKPKKCKEHKKKDKSHGDCATTTATVGATGGTITTNDGLTVAIPPGALDGTTTISVTTTDVAPPSGIGAVSPVYEFEPDGMVFASPIQVTLPLPAGVTSASVYWSQLAPGTGFDSLGGTINGSTITVDTVHFSYAVIGDPSNDRTVTGVAQDTWISATSRQSLPSDASGQSLEAIVEDSMGNLVSRPGTFAADGTFTIPNVPNGQYLLHAFSPSTEHLLMVTSGNAPDLGRRFGGKPLAQRSILTQPTTLELNISNLESWDEGDTLEMWSSQVDNWSFGLEDFDPVTPGATSKSFSIDGFSIYNTFATAEIIGPGDVLTVGQMTLQQSTNNVPYLGMARVGTVTQPFSMLDGQTNVANVTLAPLTGPNAETLNVDYRGTSFVDALNTYGYPTREVCDFCGGFVGALAQPGLVTDGFYSANADLMLLLDNAETGTNHLTGDITFAKETSLDGTWGTLYVARFNRRHITVRADSTGPGPLLEVSAFDGVSWVTTKAGLQAAAITPPLTPVQNATVNGNPFFAGGGLVGETPTVAWTAPAVGTPLFYKIEVLKLTLLANGRTGGVSVAQVSTPETSFTFPPGILSASDTYVFSITAQASTSAASGHGTALATAPFKATNEVATARISSGVFGDGYVIPAARRLQSGLQYPLGAAHNTTKLFWAEHVDEITFPPVTSNSGRIWMSNPDGSNRQMIASGQASPFYMAADDTAVYWSNYGNGVDATLERYDLGTGVQTTLVSEPYIDWVSRAPNGDLVYASAQGISVVRALGGAVELLTNEYATGLATDATTIYFSQTGSGGAPDGRILSIPLAGGSVTELVTGQAQPGPVATDGTNVYWFNQVFDFPNSKTLNQAPAAGGSATVLATGRGFSMWAFAVSGGFVYFYNSTSLKRVPVGGGAYTMIGHAPSQCADGQMVVSGGRITWLETCEGTAFQIGP